MAKEDQGRIVKNILDSQVRPSQSLKKLLKNPSTLSFYFARNTSSMRISRNRVKEKTRLNCWKKQLKSGQFPLRGKRDKQRKKRNLKFMPKLLNSAHILWKSISLRLTLMQFACFVPSILLDKSFMMVL